MKGRCRLFGGSIEVDERAVWPTHCCLNQPCLWNAGGITERRTTAGGLSGAAGPSFETSCPCEGVKLLRRFSETRQAASATGETGRGGQRRALVIGEPSFDLLTFYC